MITTAIANTKVYPITKMSIFLSLLTMSNIVAINSSHTDISSQRNFFVGKYGT
jgi:hypothetical protein